MVGFLKNNFVCSVLFSLPFVIAACEGSSGKNADNATEPVEDNELVGETEPSDDEDDDFRQVRVTMGSFTDSRDGQTYSTVKIGDQVWMAENLNFKTADSYCYNDDPSYCTKYGRLYIWSAAMDSVGVYDSSAVGCGCNYDYKNCSPSYPVRGICPEGWYLPDTVDWKTLFDAVGGVATAGKMLKSVKGWVSEWNGSNDGVKGKDAFSFSVLPAGKKFNREDDFNYEGVTGVFWSSSHRGRDPYVVVFNYYSDEAYLDDTYAYHGLSVRCLMDDGKRRQEIDKEKRRGMAEPCKTDTEDNCEYGTLKDGRDGEIYKVVKIGDQWWMAENLRYRAPQSCRVITDIYADMYGNGHYTAGFGDNIGDSKYGAFYLRDGAKRACPDGWHAPRCVEIDTLLTSVGVNYAGVEYAANMLKSSSGWNDGEDGTNRNGVDAYGFSAFPAGLLDAVDIEGRSDGYVAYFWGDGGCSLRIFGDGAYSDYRFSSTDPIACDGYPVRCIKDSSTIVELGYYPENSSASLAARVEPCKTDSTDSCEYGTLTDERDGLTYKTVKIGNQWWMAENLNYTNPELGINSLCNQNDKSCSYGHFYFWSTAMDSAGVNPGNAANGCGFGVTCSAVGTVRGICPEGWHLPTFAEFETLFAAVGGQTVAGTALKSSRGWDFGSCGDESCDGNGDDTYGFSALPSGYCVSGRCSEWGRSASFWSSTEMDDSSVYGISIIAMYFKNDYASTGRTGKNSANAVRCVKD